MWFNNMVKLKGVGNFFDRIQSASKSSVENKVRVEKLNDLPSSEDNNIINCLACISENSLACGYRNGKIIIYDVYNAQQLDFRTGHKKSINKICVSKKADPKLIFTSSRDQNIGIWNPSEGMVDKIEKVHDLTITGLASNPEGTQVVSGSRDTCVKLWDVERKTCLRKIKISRNLVTHICWNKMAGPGLGQKTNLIAQSSEDKSVKIFDSRDLKLVMESTKKSRIQTYCDITPDGLYVTSISQGNYGAVNEGEVTIWDLRTMRELYNYNEQYAPLSTCLSFTMGHLKGGDFMDQCVLVTGAKDGSLCLCSIDKTKPQVLTGIVLLGAGQIDAIDLLNPTTLVVATNKKGLEVLRIRKNADLSLSLELGLGL